MPSRRCAAFAVVAFGLAACDKDHDPVDIPFEGIEVSGDPAPPTPPESVTPPAPSASASASAPVPVFAGGIAACCAALHSASRSAKDESSRAMNSQAASVCYRQSREVQEGRTTRAAALAAVRASLLGPAPGACR
jgi:hypothetical protein